MKNEKPKIYRKWKLANLPLKNVGKSSKSVLSKSTGTLKDELESVLLEIERRKTERPILHLVDKREYKKPELVEHSIESLANSYDIPVERFKDYLFGQKNNFENLKK